MSNTEDRDFFQDLMYALNYFIPNTEKALDLSEAPFKLSTSRRFNDQATTSLIHGHQRDPRVVVMYRNPAKGVKEEYYREDPRAVQKAVVKFVNFMNGYIK